MLAEGLTSPELQYGAFGICVLLLAFAALLWKSNRQEREALGRAIERKDAQVLLLTGQYAELARQSIMAMNRLAEVLGERPCLAQSRTIQQMGEGGRNP